MEEEATCGNCAQAVRCFGARGWYLGCRARGFVAVWPAAAGCAEHVPALAKGEEG